MKSTPADDDLTIISIDGPAAAQAIENIEQKVRDGEWTMLIGSVGEPTEEEWAQREAMSWYFEREDVEFGDRVTGQLFWENHPDPLLAFEAVVQMPNVDRYKGDADWGRVFDGKQQLERLTPSERQHVLDWEALSAEEREAIMSW